jgi:hypothetical protein
MRFVERSPVQIDGVRDRLCCLAERVGRERKADRLDNQVLQ